MIDVGMGVFLAITAWADWKWRKIPNTILFPALLAGLAYHIWTGQWWTAAGGVICGFAVTVVPVTLRSMGMGDQKLLMAVGAWTSYTDVYWLFVISAALGAVAVICMPWRIGLLGRHLHLVAVGWVGHRKLWLPSYQQSALTIPFAVFIFFAFLIRQLEGTFL